MREIPGQGTAPPLGKASISTLHSFCLQLVRRHAYLVDIDPRFRVLDPEEAGLLKVEAMDELFESLHQDPEEYAPLLEHYTGKRTTANCASAGPCLFEYVESLPDPEAWLDRAARSYDPREPGERERLPKVAGGAARRSPSGS